MRTRDNRARRIEWACGGVAILLGAIHAWSSQHTMNPDGISYLDMSDWLVRGDWSLLINAYWSPLYAFVLGIAVSLGGPSPAWEFPKAHAANFLIYCGSLACFHFFMKSLLKHGSRREISAGQEFACVPDWALILLGYALWTWSSLDLITLSLVSPDMLVSSLVYLAYGLFLQILNNAARISTWGAFGLTLGIGYWAKTILFSWSVALLMFIAAWKHRSHRGRVLIAVAAFAITALPLVAALSNASGRFTLGDSGKLNYSWHVNGTPALYWQGEPAGTGTPEHAPHLVWRRPAVYEFGAAVRGTHPLWFDPAYWYEGLATRVDLRKQVRAVLLNLRLWSSMFFLSPYSIVFGALLSGLIALGVYQGSGRQFLRGLAGAGHLLIVPGFVMLLYTLVHIEPRYAAPFIVLFWLALYWAARLEPREASRRLLPAVVVGITCAIGISLTASTAYAAYRWMRTGEAQDVTRRAQGDPFPVYEPERPALHGEIARGLEELGVKAGDRIAQIGWGFDAFWARLARVRIVAEIPRPQAHEYWACTPEERQSIAALLRKAGAVLLVAERTPFPLPPGWERIGQTGYYACKLAGPEAPERLADASIRSCALP